MKIVAREQSFQSFWGRPTFWVSNVLGTSASSPVENIDTGQHGRLRFYA
jgi:hypothetical protein